jgi:hypothetical protein
VDRLKSGIYSVPEGATIGQLFQVCAEENRAEISEEDRRWLMFLADGRPAGWDTVLGNVKRVHVLRAIMGG